MLLFQFGSAAESLLVLVAVPLGFIGVIVALYVGKSTLSLNSALGVILLNGIAVNNSIIMVDFIRRLHAGAWRPGKRRLVAAAKRLRPILITSMTTILGTMRSPSAAVRAAGSSAARHRRQRRPMDLDGADPLPRTGAAGGLRRWSSKQPGARGPADEPGPEEPRDGGRP